MNTSINRTRTESFLALLLITVLTARKFGLPMTGILLPAILFSIAILLFSMCITGTWRQRAFQLLGLVCLLLVTPRLLVSYYSPALAKTGAILATMSLFYQVFSHRIHGMIRPLPATVLIVVMAVGWPETGSYHRWFRKGTFESYITAHFPAGSEKAYLICRSNARKVDNPESFQRTISEQAIRYEKIKDLRSALASYDDWLDAFPDSPEGYLRRGRLRLYDFESNQENALAAVKDFTRAIRLDSLTLDAYFYRAQANSLIEPRPDICEDLEMTLRLDSMRKSYVMEMAALSCPELLRRLLPRPADP